MIPEACALCGAPDPDQVQWYSVAPCAEEAALRGGTGMEHLIHLHQCSAHGHTHVCLPCWCRLYLPTDPQTGLLVGPAPPHG
jgi:hypothetical protein